MDRISRRVVLALSAAAVAGRAHGQSATSNVGGVQDFTLGGPQATGGEAVVIPVTSEGIQVLIPVSVNGGPPVPFVFDTGSVSCMLDRDFAVQSQVSTSWGTEATGAKLDETEIGMAEGVSLQVGSISIPNQTVAVMQMPNHIVDRGIRPRIGGIFGVSAFSDRTLRLDMMRRSLTWLPNGTPPNPLGISMPLKTELDLEDLSASAPQVGKLTIPVTLEGITQDFVLDTGASAEVVLSYANAHKLGALQRYSKYVKIKAPGGIDGAIDVSIAFGNSLSAGQAVFAPPSVAMETDPPSGLHYRYAFQETRGFDGLLGLAALAQYVIFLDIPNQRLVLEPGGVHKTHIRRFCSIGICAGKPTRTAFEVLSTIQGTPAAQAGIAPGDKIVAVNGQPAIDLSLADFGRFTDGKAGTQATLSFADGRVLTLASVQLLP